VCEKAISAASVGNFLQHPLKNTWWIIHWKMIWEIIWF